MLNLLRLPRSFSFPTALASSTRTFALSSISSITSFDYPHLLRSCKSLNSLLPIHARLLFLGADSDDSILTLLLNSYSSFHRPDSALAVFNSSPNPTVILWNSMIRCYTRAGEHKKAISFYHRMLERGIEPDKYSFTFVLKACAGALDSQNGILIHREVSRRGLLGDVFIATGLVDMYCKLGMVTTARELFDSMPVLDTVTWNAMIAGFSQSGSPCQAFTLFRKMQENGELPNSVTILNLLPAICELSYHLLCRAVHGFVTRRCFSDVVSNGLIDTYCKCGRAEVARKLFDGMSNDRDDVSWGTMISGYVHNGLFMDALDLFDGLRRSNVKLNQVSVVSALSAAAELADSERGMDIHRYAVQREINFDVAVNTALVTMYAKIGDMEKAKLLFDGIQNKDIIAWSAMISAFVQAGYPREALSLFQEMQMRGIKPNRVTLVCILPACADLLELNLGKSIHSFVLRSDTVLNVSVGTALVAMYAKCGSFKSAHALFDGLESRDVITWNALINGYAQIGEADKALKMFQIFHSEGKQPDPGTMVGVLPAYALLNNLREGTCIHGMVIKYGFESDLHLKNATIDMYAKCGDLPSSESLFNATRFHKDIISWNTMIAGYMHNGQASEAISAFHLMRAENIKPNLVSLVSLLPATAYLAALRDGLTLHSYAIRSGFESNVLVGNCLLDMYSKCGRLDYAWNFFNQMSHRDTVSWNVMLAGYAVHGQGDSAISLFSHMKDSCIEADMVTYLGVLSACRHGGLVAEGKKIFDSMIHENIVEPNLEHYACMVDLLGRAGQLDEAWNLIQRMPMTPDAGVWGALLGACRMHSDIKIGEIALKQLARLEPANAAHYVVLSNIYAQVGRWSDAGKMRTTMSETRLKKTPGCSWVEIKNIIHAFRVGDQSHPQFESMCDLWNDLQAQMEKMG
ncbi:pentatricopeptide repeat-containing protein At2g39620 [Typha angustifolia]|uniref:pentatricopeptide repeat-containing protein At2g39620 n=1 Tax=Typha angustifolia TaxID=59011 RepID=UPI003C2DB3CB